MSLDVYLEEGQICPVCGADHRRGREVFSAYITDGFIRMAEEAGIYRHLWRPEEIGIDRAEQLIVPLEAGLATMKADPARFRQYDVVNGWGKYEDFVPWIEEYLEACKAYQKAKVTVSR